MNILKLIRYKVISGMELQIVKYKFKKHNINNKLRIMTIIPDNVTKCGNYSYGPIELYTDSDKYKLVIGSFCSIASNVSFLLDVEHNTNCISTYPFKNMILNVEIESFAKGDIIVDDDVWIGYGATIMSGVHIGQGAVVAAGAVVTKDVPPYAIVGGVPAKVIKYRFEPYMIEELLKIDYSKLTKEDIEKHIDDLYTELKNPSQLDWMPKKG